MWKKNGCSQAANGAMRTTAALGLYMFHDLEVVMYNAKKICKVIHADPRYVCIFTYNCDEWQTGLTGDNVFLHS